MNREHAIRIISSLECHNFSREDRELIINNSWGFNEGDEEISLLSLDLREELLHYDAPQEDIMSPKYDRLVEVACELSYSQFSNERLQVMVSEILKKPVTVEGIISPSILFKCPCCGKTTLSCRGEYDICPNCNWEDDGNDNEDKYSLPNHMTLKEGKQNFLTYGSSVKKNK